MMFLLLVLVLIALANASVNNYVEETRKLFTQDKVSDECTAAVMLDAFAAAKDAMSNWNGQGTLIVSPTLSDSTCNICYTKSKPCCPTGPSTKKGSEGACGVDVGFQQFYDCKSGGSKVDATTFCKQVPNGKYYAVIIVPVIAFVFIIAGLLYVFRSKIFGGSVQKTVPLVETTDKP